MTVIGFNNLTIETNTGSTSSFFSIIESKAKARGKTLEIRLGGWISKEKYDAGREPNSDFTYTMSINPLTTSTQLINNDWIATITPQDLATFIAFRDKIYNYIVALPQWSGANIIQV